VKNQGSARHRAAPRTLLFLERDGRVLLIQGAAHKWWAGRWNGLGGGVRPGEDILAAARREAREETGLEPTGLRLAAIGHVAAEPPVLIFVFLGALPDGEPRATPEGELRWFSREDLSDSSLSLMPDLPELLPRLWALPPDGHPLFYVSDSSGRLTFREPG
jgi:8-oxo-dGTP diphosphatase